MASILVVEDEAIVATEIQYTLRGLGHDVPQVASSGEDALQIVARRRPDLVLMDIRLQGELDGIETAARLREQSDVPVVYLTANSEDAYLSRASETNAYGYLLKPFDGRALRAAIELALRKHRVDSRRRSERKLREETLRSACAELEISNDLLFELATRDELTGVFNRRELTRLLTQELSSAANHSSQVAMILLDIDHFKAINDRYGHAAGDEVLRQVGRVVSGAVREQDYAARYGGEEFAVVLPSADMNVALAVAERMRAAMAGFPFNVQDLHGEHHQLWVTASAGVAVAPQHGSSTSALFARCDDALYQAKAHGRNRVMPAMNSLSIRSSLP